MPTETECAYLAGFVDGEGTLTITRHTRKDRPGYKRFNLRVAVYNTNFTVLNFLQNIFGGTIMVAERENNWKPQGQLAWSEAQIIEILQAIRPYLIIKGEQADILLAMQETKMPASKGRRNGQSAEVIALRNEAYCKLKILNKRGK